MPGKYITDVKISKLGGDQVAPQANSAAGLAANRRAINLRHGFHEVMIEPAADIRLALAPKIGAVLFYDASADEWTDLLSGKAIVDSSRTGAATFVMDDNDYIYARVSDRIGGFRFDLDGSLINNDASTLNLDYSAANGFVNTAITDGTASGGATFAQDGNVTIDTIPADGVWAAKDLKSLVPSVPDDVPGVHEKGYWVRLYATAITGAPLDQVEIEQLIPFAAAPWTANSATSKGDSGWFKGSTEYTIDLDDDVVGALEFIAESTSAATTLNITWISKRGV